MGVVYLPDVAGLWPCPDHGGMAPLEQIGTGWRQHSWRESEAVVVWCEQLGDAKGSEIDARKYMHLVLEFVRAGFFHAVRTRYQPRREHVVVSFYGTPMSQTPQAPSLLPRPYLHAPSLVHIPMYAPLK